MTTPHYYVEELESLSDLSSFSVLPDSERNEEYEVRISKIQDYLQTAKNNFAGYQVSQKQDYSRTLGACLDYQINNAGDPYSESTCRVTTKATERALIQCFSKLWNTPYPARSGEVRGSNEVLDEKYWSEGCGHALTAGCTEGSIFALRNARDYLKGKYVMSNLYLPISDEFQNKANNVSNTPFLQPRSPFQTSNSETSMFSLLSDGVNIQTPVVRGIEDPHGNVVHKFSLKHSSRDHYNEQPLIPLHLDSEISTKDPLTHGVSVNSNTDLTSIVKYITKQGLHENDSQQQQLVQMHGITLLKEFMRKVHSQPILFYSNHTHYSIGKIKDLLELHTPETVGNVHYPGECPASLHTDGVWPAMVPTNLDGTINVNMLKDLVKFFTDRHHTVIIVCNYGTTFTGVHDDVEAVYNILNKSGCLKEEESIEVDGKQMLRRRNYWIHVDAALGGLYGALFDKNAQGRLDKTAKLLQREVSTLPHLPGFTFNVPGVASIATSGHKFMGAPFPTGLVMTLRKYMMHSNTNISYIGAPDTTIAGSRNGLGTLIMWSCMARRSEKYHAEQYIMLLELARKTAERFAQVATDIAREDLGFTDLTVLHNVHYGIIYNFQHSLSILFPQPESYIIDKYSLSCDQLRLRGGQERQCAHIYIMDHVTMEKIEEIAQLLRHDSNMREAVKVYHYNDNVAKSTAPIYAEDGDFASEIESEVKSM